MIFISHDLAVVRKILDRIIVMKKGRIVEEGSVEEIYNETKCNYTKELISAILPFPFNDFIQDIERNGNEGLETMSGARLMLFPKKALLSRNLSNG